MSNSGNRPVSGLGRLAAVVASLTGVERSRLDPWDLHFDEVARRRPVDVVAPRFRLLADGFDGDEFEPRYDELSGPSGPAAPVTRGGGVLTLGGRAHDTLLRTAAPTEAPYTATTVAVSEFSGDDARDRVQAGLVRTSGDGVLAWYDHATRTAGVDVTTDGTTATLVTAAADLTAPVRFSFALTSSTVVAFADGGTGPVPLVRADVAGVAPDLRRPEVLAGHRAAFGASSGFGVTVLDEVEAGYFGQLGLRDPHLVTFADGTPYLRDGKAYLTFTNAGLGYFETAHWGVWTLDLDTFDVEHVGKLFFRRGDGDHVLGDHAGHLVRDERRGRWIVTTSTWGDFTGTSVGDHVDIHHTRVWSGEDLLHGVHVLRTRPLPLPLADLPGAAVGQWDPHLVRVDDRWYVTFVNARRYFEFYPVLVGGAPRGDYTDLRLIGADDARVDTEGTVLQRFGGEWFLLASNGPAAPGETRGQYPVYDLTMAQVGVLDAPHTATTTPWPMVLPVPDADGTGTRWLMVTFDGTQYDAASSGLLGHDTHGDVVVMAAGVTAGREFS